MQVVFVGQPLLVDAVMSNLLDFNSAVSQYTHSDQTGRNGFDRGRIEKIKEGLSLKAEAVLFHLYPAGRMEAEEFCIGNIQGTPGDSMKISLAPGKRGVWKDFATPRKGGDLISIWMQAQNVTFNTALDQIEAFLGSSATVRSNPCKPYELGKAPVNRKELGPVTGKWNYTDMDGNVVATVTRYDPEPGKKEFRPWDAIAKKHTHPAIRPLYNIVGLSQSQKVVLVEGEKCAEALLSLGICATTAMGGASAPIGKTDWAPLKGKVVVIWPDNDEPGKKYAQLAKQTLEQVGCEVTVLQPPKDKSPKWDCADAVAEGFDVQGFLIFDQPTVGIKILSLNKLMGIKCEFNWLIEDLLGEKESLVIPGKSGIGKSLLTLDMALHLAQPEQQSESDLDFNSQNKIFDLFTIAKPLTSLFIQAENSIAATQKRLRIMLQGQPHLKDCLNRIHIPYLNNNIRLSGNLAEQVFSDWLLSQIDAYHVDVLFLDPLISYHSEDENDNGAMRKLLEQIDRIQERTGFGLVLVHHVGKSTVDNDVFPGRGASSIGDWSPNTLILKPGPEMRDEEGRLRDIIECSHLKCRNGVRKGTFWLERDQYLFTHRIDNPKEKTTRKDAAQAVECLRQVNGYVESRKELVALIQAASNVSVRTAQSIIKDAFDQGLIQMIQTYGNQVGYKLPEIKIPGF